MKKIIKTLVIIAIIISSTLGITHFSTPRRHLGTQNISSNIQVQDTVQVVSEPFENSYSTPISFSTANENTEEIIQTPEPTQAPISVPVETPTIDTPTAEINQITFSGINQYSNEDLSFEYLNSWSPSNSTEDSDVDFLINGRNGMFSIVKESIPEDFTMDDYVSSTQNTLKEKENYSVVSIEDATHNEISGKTIIYQIYNPNTNTTSIINEFCVIHNKLIYVFTYYTDATKYENYLNEFNDLLDTLVFLN